MDGRSGRTVLVTGAASGIGRGSVVAVTCEPEEIAAAAAWLCSPQASPITATVLSADGGWLAG